MKKLVITLIFIKVIFASDLIKLPLMGVDVDLDGKKFTIQREVHSDCIGFGMEPRLFWSRDFASSEVSKKCKKELITSKGMIQPMYFNDKIKTIGELEVLEFIKEKINKEPKKYALVDSRPEHWFEYGSLPTAISVPYDELVEDELFMESYQRNLKKLGIKKSKNGFDFSEAKTVVLFCNGPWCVQSNRAMKNLINMGYPQEKMMWYRGGIHSWVSMSLPLY